MWFGRPTWAEIDLDAIAANVRAFRAHLPPATGVLAVVKGEGYGHGAVEVARVALAAGATGLAVNFADEGVALRQAGLASEILVLGYVPAWEARKALQHDLTVTVHSRQTALALAAAAQERGQPAAVQLKVDSGLSRFGLQPAEAIAFGEWLRGLPWLELTAVWTHFASADEADKTFSHQQIATFRAVADRLGPGLRRHAANSAGAIDLPAYGFDAVRIGISLYGLYPSDEVRRSVPLRPALALKSRVARLAWLEPGTTVGYGRTWRAERRTQAALVPCGYADGLPRSLSNRGEALVGGQRAPYLGRVSMDQIVVDVTHIPAVGQDDEVVLIGRQGAQEVSAEELARLDGTINYEIVTQISARVPRVYLRGGAVVGVKSVTGLYASPQVFQGTHA